MKKILLILGFLASTFISFSQSRLGYTEAEIKSDLYLWTFQSAYTNDDSTYYIYSETPDNYVVAYYFNSSGICNFCKLYTSDNATLNTFVQKYNNQYVIISDTKWKMYNSNGVMNIELIFKDGFSYFIYY